MHRLTIVLSLFLQFTALSSTAGDSVAQLEFFERRIRPVLLGECIECHGESKQKGGLRLDFRDGLLKGGRNGPAIVPGDSEVSLLIQSITHNHPEIQMPKDRPMLSQAAIADFVTWVDDGAHDPRDTPPREDRSSSIWEAVFEARKDWWSFKPVQKTHPPAIANSNTSGWTEHPVDRFLAAKMSEKGLAPASPAERQTVLRRLSFALTGLPPKPAEIQSFFTDNASDAYEKQVDRLLASPHFGEHWGRHWLDLVRFAETHGSEGDPEIPNAWRYRDYIIRAHNSDVPWDRLIREHLAGDLVEPRWNEDNEINESLLGLAHFRLVEHGFNPIDTLDEQVKTIDSQIDVISKAFQGLTVSCARCHDHKFDPISQRDYYAMYGVFASVRPTQLTLNHPDPILASHRTLEQLKTELKSGLVDEWENAVDRLGAALEARESKEGLPLSGIPGDDLAGQIKRSRGKLAALEEAARQRLLHGRGATDVAKLPLPVAAWDFEQDARDIFGKLDGTLHGKATVRNGRLFLDGTSGFLETKPIPATIHQKSLEVWVNPATLDQSGGGVLTIEVLDGSVFDGIVFGEKEPRKWISGSDFHRRTASFGGPAETAIAPDLIHLVIAYDRDNKITAYRNGEMYGSYSPNGKDASLRKFDADTARVLIGKRHTGGGNALFNGQIEEARLYDRALRASEVAASFKAGPGLITPEAVLAALTPEERRQHEVLIEEVSNLEGRLTTEFPRYKSQAAQRDRLLAAIDAATATEDHPLNAWLQLIKGDNGKIATAWANLREAEQTRLEGSRQFNSEKFTNAWIFNENAKDWFARGIVPPKWTAPGNFPIEPEGDILFKQLLPAGVYSHLLSQKHNGTFASPRFRVSTDYISVRVLGGKGARVRLIPDNYPIGQGNIYPQATLNSDEPVWVRLDVSYRKGTMAWLEIATAGEVTSRDAAPPGADGRSFFGIDRVIFHDTAETPRDEFTANAFFFDGGEPASARDVRERILALLKGAIQAWNQDRLSEPQRLYLHQFIKAGLLPCSVEELQALHKFVFEYRATETAIRLPVRAPGVTEGEAIDAPLLSRGNHLQPLDAVPRGAIQLISPESTACTGSGRLELANAIASPENPLTSRVLVNRIWHHLFGRGLVATVDNFGRLGQQPTHPELLDYLANRFIDQGWSAKELIRFLVTSQAFQCSAEASARAREVDPANELLSHAPVRRLGAESIRDSMLAVSGRLDTTMSGPGANALAGPSEQRRRAIYLTVRRNFLSPFLETFDFPKPFSTLGRRDTTTVPAQSLALLNDPFVIEQATHWAKRVIGAEADTDERIHLMFAEAFGRRPADDELELSRACLADLRGEYGEDELAAWRDFAQSLFNLKEFIYLK